MLSDNCRWVKWNITKFHISWQRWFSLKYNFRNLAESVFHITAISFLSINNKYTDCRYTAGTCMFPARYPGGGEVDNAVTSNGVLSTCRTDCNHVNNNNASYHECKRLFYACCSTRYYEVWLQFSFCARYGVGELICWSAEHFQNTFDSKWLTINANNNNSHPLIFQIRKRFHSTELIIWSGKKKSLRINNLSSYALSGMYVL